MLRTVIPLWRASSSIVISGERRAAMRHIVRSAHGPRWRIGWCNAGAAGWLLGGQHERRRIAPHDQRVLHVRRAAAAVGHERPAVVELPHLGVAGRDHRLDRDHEPLGQRLVVGRIVEVEDGRGLVQAHADPMAGQLAQDREAAALDLRLDRRADRVARDARAGDRDPLAQGDLGSGDHPRRRRPRLADRQRDAGVGVVAVELGRDVELDDVAVAQAARAGDAVDGLVVDADADRAGEVVGQDRAGARAVTGEDARGDVVQLARGDARPDVAAQLAQRGGDDGAGALQSGKVGRCLDRHGSSMAAARRRSGAVVLAHEAGVEGAARRGRGSSVASTGTRRLPGPAASDRRPMIRWLVSRF
jgi:hypothetical protein